MDREKGEQMDGGDEAQRKHHYSIRMVVGARFLSAVGTRNLAIFNIWIENGQDFNGWSNSIYRRIELWWKKKLFSWIRCQIWRSATDLDIRPFGIDIK